MKDFKHVGMGGAILVVFALICQIYSAFKVHEVTGILWSIACVAAFVVALIYTFSGYKKSAAPFYKAYLLLFAASELMAVIDSLVLKRFEVQHVIFGIIVPAVFCVVLVFLAFVKDFGKTKSFIVCGIIMLAYLVLLIYEIAVFDGENLQFVFGGFGRLILALYTGVMVYAKYENKAKRGRE